MSEPNAPSQRNFTCRECGKEFSVKEEILARYPGWQPSLCFPCKDRTKKGGQAGKKSPAKKRSAKKRGPRKSKASGTQELNLTTREVLERFTEGPFEGVFTDGACSGNPGPGGWGTVWVQGNQMVQQENGQDAQTTNNRMELAALIAAYEMLPEDAEETIYSDSNLCVQTVNQWAAGWKANGWKRKTGPVKNLELVKRAYELSLTRPKVKLRWIKAHNGSRWNEYADSLATAYLREEL